MSETLKRIAEKTESYRLSERECELILRYFRLHLTNDQAAREPKSLIESAAAARHIASMWADLPEKVIRSVPDGNDTPIGRAARIMYFVAELLDDTELTAHWANESAIAYLQGGNFAAASTALSLSRTVGAETQPGEVFLNALLGLRGDCQKNLADLPLGLRAPWRCASRATARQAQQDIYKLCARQTAVFDKSVGYRVSQLLPLVGSLSLLRVLRTVSRKLPKWYRRALRASRRLILLPSQVPALLSWLGANSGNGLLCTPTSSGKTLVAEIVGLLELEHAGHGIAIFVVPYQAIAYNVTKTLEKRTVESDVKIVSAFGYEPIDRPALRAQKAAIVCTPERLNALLFEAPEILARTQFIVFDEVHIVAQCGGAERGAFYECIISRVLLEQQRTGWPRRICGMSAVVENVEELAGWFRSSPDSTIVGTWRPNPLIPAYWDHHDDLLVITDTANINKETIHRFSAFCPRMPAWPFPWIRQEALANKMKLPLGERIAWFTRHWTQTVRGPALVFCASRKQTRELATMAADKRKESQLSERVKNLVAFLEREFPYLSLLRYCLQRGVAYHNASLPAKVRRRLEDLFQEGAVSVVYATTTLAEGADFPFRTVLIASPSHYDPDSKGQSAMSPLLIRNIAGRGGRTSGYLIGDVIQMYSPFRMQTSEGAGIESHEVFLQHLLDPAKSVVSSALRDGVVASSRSMATATLIAAFDRVVHRWPAVDDILPDFRRNLLSPELRDGFGTEVEAQYQNRMLSAETFGEPLATINSPLRLTTLGEIVVATGYQVESAAAIWSTMEGLGWFGKDPDFAEIIAACSKVSIQIPEARELRESNRRPLRAENLARVIKNLIDGGSVTDAYLIAEHVAGSGTQKKALELVAGRADNDATSHERIEVFLEDLKYKLIHELPVLISAMQNMLEYRRPGANVNTFNSLLKQLTDLRMRIE
jgi:helicase